MTALTQDEIFKYVKEAKQLGLESVKIIGRGEPFEEEGLLEFIENCNSLGIGVAVFTKGHVLGSDMLTSHFFGKRYDIHTAECLIRKLKRLDVSVLLGFNTFDRQVQERLVGVTGDGDRDVLKNYVDYRDRALQLLVQEGFNDFVPGMPTRLAMIAAPITSITIDFVFDLYVWARKRNIYLLGCPTTLSGKGIDEFERESDLSGYFSRLEELYVRVNSWAIMSGVIKLNDFLTDGPSLYCGCHPCNQVAAGVYLTLSGRIVQCPGRVDDDALISHDIRQEKDFISTWIKSANHRRAVSSINFNYFCVARDGRSLPVNFYDTVKSKILKNIEVSGFSGS